MKIKENISLIFGIAIPILMILFVAGSIYLPGIFVKPKFNFLYTNNNYYSGTGWRYAVQDGKLTRTEFTQKATDSYIPPRYDEKLFIYNVSSNDSREISFEEAQKLNLDTSPKSPDGFEITYGSHESGIFPFFFEGGNYNQYLKGHNVSRKLNLQGSGYYNFHFMGWIQ